MAQSEMKWTNWSAHFAWGIAFAALPLLWHCPEAKAVVVSLAAGALWELLYWVCMYYFGRADQRRKARPSFVDWLVWGLGTGAVVLVV